MQYLRLSLKKEKENQEKNNQKESQEEKEIACPRFRLGSGYPALSNAVPHRNREYIVFDFPGTMKILIPVPLCSCALMLFSNL